MGLLKSGITVRRFRVAGELPEGFREIYRERLGEFAFQEPPVVGTEEVEGWTLLDDVTTTDFENFNRWLIDNWLVFGLRIDKRVLPAKVFRATVDKAVRAWCEERSVERCPSAVKSEIRDALKLEWLRRTMPRTNHHEVAWNIDTNMMYVSTHSDTVCDRLRKRFYRTFGRRMIPHSPLDWVGDETVVSALLERTPGTFQTGAI